MDSPTDEVPSPTPQQNNGTKIPKPSAQPRKGILKRSGSVSSPRSPLSEIGVDASVSDSVVRRGSLRALPWTPPAPGSQSKIPKLSVTWWETSSAYGDTPSRNRRAKSNTPPRHIGHEQHELVHEIHEEPVDVDDVDDTESLHSCASSVAGTWWFGRQTRYVPHCDKRHLHLDESEQYVTPTQRKNREIVELKKQLKSANKITVDKEAHLNQLRERLTELEQIMDQGGLLIENRRLIAKANLMKDEYERDKRSLMEEFEIRLRKAKNENDRDSAEREASLQFELDELRSRVHPVDDFSLSPKPMDESDSGISRSAISDQRMIITEDQSTMTDEAISVGQIQQDLHAFKYENSLLRNRVAELEYSLKQFEADLGNDLPCDNKACTTRQRSMCAHLEAYKNECSVWRMKSSEMEIALKQMHNAKSSLEQQLTNYEQQLKIAKLNAAAASQSSNSNSHKRLSVDDGVGKFTSTFDDSDEGFFADGEISDEIRKDIQQEFAKMRGHIKRLECQLDDTKKQMHSVRQRNDTTSTSADYNELLTESAKLSQENDVLASKLKSTERQLDESRRTVQQKEDTIKSNEQMLLSIDQQLLSKRTELEVFQLSCQKLRDENERVVTDKLALEEKINNLESTMAECGVIIGPPANLRRKMSRSPNIQQTVYRARDCQTDLNYQEELLMENELKDLRERHAVLQRKYDGETNDLESRVSEITKSLMLKNNLVTTLTNQIQLLQNEIAGLHEGFERERCMYNERMHEVNLVAQRVPFLEQDVNTAREELRAIEKEYNREREKFEKTLENSMSDVIKSQQDTSLYFRQRLQNAEMSCEKLKKQLEECKQELSDERMRSTLRNVELERQLESNLNEVQRLQTKIFANRRNVEVQVQPEIAEKAVLCYVRTIDKCTEMLKGELYDERDEQLKVLQGELHATRRQVEVLQDKLLILDVLHQQLSDVEQRKLELTSKCKDLQKQIELSDAERKIERDDFDLKYHRVVVEKERMARAEEERYHRLEAEFDNVRQELDAVIQRYESQKAELKSKLDNLEKECEDRKRVEDDVRNLKSDLNELELNYEREKSDLVRKETELAELKEQLKRVADKSSENAGFVEENDLFIDISGLEKQITEMTAECDQLRETDILDSASDLRSLSTIEGDVPILTFFNKPLLKPVATKDSFVTVDDEKSVTKSPDMVSARDSVSTDEADLCKLSSDPLELDLLKFQEILSLSAAADDGVNAEERKELVNSIQAQTHLLQTLRAELEEEQKKHQDVKINLYERIQKLARENVNVDGQVVSRVDVNNSSVVFAENDIALSQTLLSLPTQQESDAPATATATTVAKTPTLRQAVIEMKAKILYLLHENQELRSDMKELKRSVSVLLNREDISNLRRPTFSNDDIRPVFTNGQSAYYSVVEEEFPKTDVDLIGLRDDLQQIVTRFDLTSDMNDERDKEEAMLMKWLKQELSKEKCELDVLVKWYESDKAKLELQLTAYKIRTESAECERDFYRRKFDATQRQLTEVSLELDFFKQEDPLKYQTVERKVMTKFHSDSALCPSSALARKKSFKEKLRKTTCELFGLERKYASIDKERRDVQQELSMLKGEFVMLEMQYETDKEFWTHDDNQPSAVMSRSAMSCDDSAQTDSSIDLHKHAGDESNNVPELSSKEMEDMKKQLHHAEQCAARLDSEASHWQSELALLKNRLKNSDISLKSENMIEKLSDENQILQSRLSSVEQAKQSMSESFQTQMSDLSKQLRQAEQNAASLEAVVSCYGEQCLGLKQQMVNTSTKQQQIVERQTAELNALKQRHEQELLSLNDEIRRLKSELDLEKSVKRERSIVSDSTLRLDDREASDAETVVGLLHNLEKKDKELFDIDSKLQSAASEADKMREKYETEIANLRSHLTALKQDQTAKVGTIKSQVESTLSSLAENLRASNEEVSSIKDQYEMVIDNLQKKLEGERFRLTLFEEKSAHFEREFQMVTKELELKCRSFDDERRKFESENQNLRKRLYSAALSIEVAEKSMDVENALDTAAELQDKLASLMAEMDVKEKKHQEMYAVMFQKGQYAARAEMLAAGLDTASSSSTEWVFETGLSKGASPVDVGVVGGQLQPNSGHLQQPATSSSQSSTATPTELFESRLHMELSRRSGSGDKLNEDEVRLRFLRDAVYYYLLGRDTKDHLQAIMSILKFSERQRHDIFKAKSLG